MELAIKGIILKRRLLPDRDELCGRPCNLTEAVTGFPYVIKEIDSPDKNMKDFLFTLGCYEGQTITVISALAENYVINVKDARYSIDKDLARAIIL